MAELEIENLTLCFCLTLLCYQSFKGQVIPVGAIYIIYEYNWPYIQIHLVIELDV